MARLDQDDEWFHLCQVGQTIMAAYPDFDTRTYGKAKLSDLIGAIRTLETRRDGNHLLVRRITRQTKSAKT